MLVRQLERGGRDLLNRPTSPDQPVPWNSGTTSGIRSFHADPDGLSFLVDLNQWSHLVAPKLS